MTNKEAALNVERTVFFSDAVIAIALTLLALELPLPHQGDINHETGKSMSLWQSFGSHTGSYIAFMISFSVISMFWYHHHRFFQHIAKISTRLLIWNMVGLFAIVVVPFTTKMLMGQDMGVEDGKNALGTTLYASTMLLWGISYIVMGLVARKEHLFTADHSDSSTRAMIFGAASALSMFAVSMPIAFYNSTYAQLSWMLIPVVSIVANRFRNRVVASAAT